jgi:ABC-2 type transport system permease protein/oleandomycin transport system permease protein
VTHYRAKAHVQEARGRFTVIFPLIFASSTFVPVATMPGWLRVFAQNSPITAIADAARGLSLGHALAHGPEAALVWLGAIVLVSSAAVNVLYRRMSA